MSFANDIFEKKGSQHRAAEREAREIPRSMTTSMCVISSVRHQ